MKSIDKVVSKICCIILATSLVGSSVTLPAKADENSVPVVKQGNYEVAYWKDFAKGCVTYTFDDGYDSHFSTVRELFDKYGYKATMYLVVNFMYDAKWSLAAEMAQDGYEMGSHTVTHNYLTESTDDEEYSNSKTVIEEKIGMPCLTVAYPYCYVPSTSTAAQYYISGRGCDGDIESGTPYEYLNIGSITCGSQYGINATSMISMIEKARDNNGWAVFLIHGINSGEYDALGADNLESTLSYIAENDEDYYVATFVGATKYSKERDNVKLTEISSDDGSMTLKMEDDLDNEIYDSALSVRVPNSNNWEAVTVTQSGKEVYSELKDGYIYFEAIPDRGDITIKDSSVKTSTSIEISGYQISYTYEGYRTLYSIDDPEDEIESVGMIYGMEQTCEIENMVIDGEGVYAYEATDKGKSLLNLLGKDTSTTYAMTMKFAAKTAEYYCSKIYVRAYAKLKEGGYIYSDVKQFTVYSLAQQLYQGQMMSNIQGHNFLYTDILHIVNNEYIETEYDYSKIFVK